MKRISTLVTLALTMGLLSLPWASPAAAHETDCDVGNATWNAAVTYDAVNDECDLDTAIVQNGVLNIGHTLHIGPAGKITTNANGGITLNIAGDLIVDIPSGATGSNGISGNVTTTGGTGFSVTVNATGNVVLHGDSSKGAKISSDQIAGSCTGGKGGTIVLNADSDDNLLGDVLVQDGAEVTVNARCPAGDITITGVNIDIDGLVESKSTQSGTGNNQNTPKGGGKITIDATCTLTVRGKVSSEGQDPGADLVHLEGGCEVRILGLVQSIGVGHGLPVTNFVHSNGCGGGLGQRPEKEFEAAHANGSAHRGNAACLEIWAGDLLFIDAPSGGQVHVGEIQSPNKSWTDLFARGDIVINGCTNECAYFAVNDNGRLTSTNTFGGTVTVKSKEGFVTATNKAIQAIGSASGGDGGKIVVEAALDVTLDTAHLDAHGDFVPTVGIGGQIAVRSFQQDVSWQNGIGDVRDNATGTIALTACGDVTTTGTNFNGEVPTVDDTACPPPSEPSFKAYVVFPTCECADEPDGFCEKAPVRAVLDPDSGKFPGNTGPDVVVEVHNGGIIQDAVDAAVPAGDLNLDGYIIIGVVAKDGGLLGGHTTQGVDIAGPYELPFALIACSVTMHDPNTEDGLPVGHIAAGAGSSIFVMDLHAEDGDAEGWLVEGDGRYIRNVKVRENATGISFVGDGNTMHNGAAEDNAGVGILVQGNGNLIKDADSFGNGGHGVQVVGDGNTVTADVGDRGKGNGGDGINVAGSGNQLLENDVYSNAGDGIEVDGDGNLLKKNDVGERGDKANGGDGINVDGAGNTLLENVVKASGGDGFDVSGGTAASPNVLKKNKSGDSGQGNGGEGYLLGGTGNGNVNPIELEENTAVANGLNGFKVTGSGHQLKKNVSGDSNVSKQNGLCAYDVAAGNVNNTGNKANGSTVSGSNGSAFPTGCVGP